MSLGRFLLRRFSFLFLTLFLISILTFVFTHVLPGNVAVMILGQEGTPESIRALEIRLGLNRPLYVQYLDWIGGVLQGDFGTSLQYNQDVLERIVTRFPRSLLLAGAASLYSITVGIPLGVIAAVRSNDTVDLSASLTAFIGVSIPAFLWGLVLIIVFALHLDWLPPGGYTSMLEDPVDGVQRAILPTLALGFVLSAYVMRMVRSSMIEILDDEYIVFARAKGMDDRAIVLKHALKNAMLPTITVVAFNMGAAFGAVIALEFVFNWPGIGTLFYSAITFRDIPMVQGVVLVVASVYMFFNFLADFLYGYIDPRIRYGER